MPRPRSTDPDAMRQAIAEVAEELFRSVGYHKTTLADIASRLGMSQANIYRFFGSKSEINGFICNRLISEFETEWDSYIPEPTTAKERLTAFFLASHRRHRRALLPNQGIYDMICAAIDENWPSMLKHIRRMTEFIGGIVAGGVASGEFQPCDTQHMASLLLLAVHPFLDPRHLSRTLQDCEILGEEEHMEQDLRHIIALMARGLSPALPPLAP